MLPELDLSSAALALWSAGVLGFLVGIVPIGLAEVFALAIGAVRPPGLALAMLGVFTATHVGAKLLWYWLGTLSDRVTHAKSRALIERGRAVLDRHPAYGAGVLAASAVASIPPFHLAAIAAGIARYPFVRFVLLCLAGRAVRFGAIAAVPALLRAWLG
jgi:membrane protein YqaA with SNARE-associated domain